MNVFQFEVVLYFSAHLMNLILVNDVLLWISRDIEICHRLLQQICNPHSRSLSNYLHV